MTKGEADAKSPPFKFSLLTLVMVIFLLVPPSLMSNSSVPAGEVDSVNADTFFVAIIYSVIMYVGVPETEASVTR